MNVDIKKIAATLCVSEPEISRALLNEGPPLPKDWFDRAMRGIYHHETAAKLITGKMDQLEEMEYAETLLDLVKNRDSKGLRDLADYIDATKGGKQQFQHFAGVLLIRNYFVATQGREPSKAEIKKVMSKSGIPCPKDDDNKGWARAFKAAGLDGLKKKKAKRGQSRHGD